MRISDWSSDVCSSDLSIGGNDFNFASIVQQCVQDFLASPSWWKDYCKDDSSVTANFTAANIATVKSRIATALQNVRAGMRNAGYSDSAWKIGRATCGERGVQYV